MKTVKELEELVDKYTDLLIKQLETHVKGTKESPSLLAAKHIAAVEGIDFPQSDEDWAQGSSEFTTLHIIVYDHMIGNTPVGSTHKIDPVTCWEDPED
jgi:hypothetical protein